MMDMAEKGQEALVQSQLQCCGKQCMQGMLLFRQLQEVVGRLHSV